MANTLNFRARFDLNIDYSRTDIVTNQTGIIDKYTFNFDKTLTNGTGGGQADILIHNQYNISTPLVLNLDSIEDSFGEIKDIDAIKCLIVENLNTTDGALNISIPSKGETYFLGANGLIFVWEENKEGIKISESEQDSLEGNIILSPFTSNVLTNIFIVGSSMESSS